MAVEGRQSGRGAQDVVAFSRGGGGRDGRVGSDVRDAEGGGGGGEEGARGVAGGGVVREERRPGRLAEGVGREEEERRVDGVGGGEVGGEAVGGEGEVGEGFWGEGGEGGVEGGAEGVGLLGWCGCSVVVLEPGNGNAFVCV